MTRKQTKPPTHRAGQDPEATGEELADLDTKPETNEGNESAMAGRVNPDA
jgi:hypothetical protein